MKRREFTGGLLALPLFQGSKEQQKEWQGKIEKLAKEAREDERKDISALLFFVAAAVKEGYEDELGSAMFIASDEIRRKKGIR